MNVVEAPVEPTSPTGQQYSPGLEGIVAARTAMSDVNGRTGKLLYRGFDIAELADKSNFEETCFLLYKGVLPTRSELEQLRRDLGENRVLPPRVLDLLRALDPQANPMDLLRTGVSALAHFDPDVEDMSTEANVRKALRLVAQTTTLVAAIGRFHRGLEPVPPDPSLSVAADFLRMSSGEVPDETSAKVFDVCLILHADHGMNASTFTARVIASTLSDIHSAVVGAIGALKGPLHGGEVQQGARRARRRHQVVRHVAAGREGGAGGQGPQSQRRLLLGQHIPRAWLREVHLHPDLRTQQDGRVDRARSRAVREQPADEAGIRICRAAQRCLHTPGGSRLDQGTGFPGL